MKKTILLILMCLFLVGTVSATLDVMLSDQGNVVLKSDGSDLETGNLTVTIYTAATGGSPLYTGTFTDKIINGSWNVMLGEVTTLSLDYGNLYYKDYEINGEDVDYTNATDGTIERLPFYAPLGEVSSEDISDDLAVSNVNVTDKIYFDANHYFNFDASDDLGYFGTQGGLFELEDSLIKFNTGSNDVDVRFSSDNDAYALWVDGGNDNIGIGTNTPGEKLHVDGNINVTTGNDICIDGGSCLSTAGGGDSWSDPVDANITLNTDNSYDLGSSTNEFKDGYFDGNLHVDYIYLGNNFLREGDTDTYISGSADKWNYVVGGINFLEYVEDDSQDTIYFNNAGADLDFRVRGDNTDYLLYTDASTDRVGIGKNDPATILDVDGTVTATSFAGDGSSLTGISAGLTVSSYYTGDSDDDSSFAIFNSTHWHTQNRKTADGGTTWAADAGTISNTYEYIVAGGDGTSAIAADLSANTILYTSDAGATSWSTSGDPPNLDSVNAVDTMGGNDFVACDTKSGLPTHYYIAYSTDGGSTWAESTDETNAECADISFFNSTHGLVVDSNGDIFKTTNSAVNWADTTHNTNGGLSNIIYATGAQTAIIIEAKNDAIVPSFTKVRYYGGSGDATDVLVLPARGVTNVVKANNGNHYFIARSSENLVLYKSTDDGASWQTLPLPALSQSDTAPSSKVSLAEYDTDKLVAHLSNGFIITIEGI